MYQVVISARMWSGIAKIGYVSKDATIAMNPPLDLLDSLCSLFLRNLTLVGGAAESAAICLPKFFTYSCLCYS